jgi:hypothetical protein
LVGRERASGESSLEDVLETLVPSYRDMVIKKPLEVYEGSRLVKGGKGEKSDSEHGLRRGVLGRDTKKDLWMGGLGLDASPIKTRSAHRKVGGSRGDLVTQGNNNTEQRALRGLKALARAK